MSFFKTVVIAILNLFFLSSLAFAQEDAPLRKSLLDKVDIVANTSDFQTFPSQEAETKAAELIGTIINSLLAFVGIIFLILTIYAGFLWMTARGDEEKVSKAQSIIKASVIGIIIVSLAFVISQIIGVIIKDAGLFK